VIMSWWRIVLCVHLLIGAAFVLWQSRSWWRETERVAHQLHWNSGWAAKVGVVFVVFVSLMCDVVNWPRCAWRLFKHSKG